MSFDWSTFTLEIVNFLVLVWLLKRFLYRPVMSMVERRRQEVQKTLRDADAARSAAERLKRDYEARGAQWEQELAQRRRQLDGVLEAERQKRLRELDAAIAAERSRRETIEARERQAHELALQNRAAAQAGRFAAHLLARLGGPELDRGLGDVLVEDLGALPPERRPPLSEALAAAKTVTITSAHALDSSVRQRVEQALFTLAGKPLTFRYAEDPRLVAGLRIGAGAWELEASLEGELKAFSELAAHG